MQDGMCESVEGLKGESVNKIKFPMKTRFEIQGAPKKMHHSDLYPISVLEVGFYFFTYVLES